MSPGGSEGIPHTGVNAWIPTQHTSANLSSGSGMSGSEGGVSGAGRSKKIPSRKYPPIPDKTTASEEPPQGGGRGRAISRATLETLHPIAHNLTAKDTESCVSLEQDAFHGVHRHDPDHIQYCLSNCSAISLGLFTSTNAAMSTATYQYARSPDSFEPQRKAALVAHIVATKTTNSTILEEDIQIGGHKEQGRTIAIHSFGVLQAYRQNGLGTMLLTSYIDRIKGSACADRIAVLANEEMIKFYQGLGFELVGDSKVIKEMDHWYDMVLNVKPGKW